MLAVTIAWDDSLGWAWENALESLQSTIREVVSVLFFFN